MKNPLVVGYKGEIGSFILQELLRHMPKAGNIWCVDVNDYPLDVRTRIRRADIIFLCIELEHTPDFIDQWASELKGKIIVEQTSLKAIMFDNKHILTLAKKYNIEFLSMHILFRPSGTPNFKDRKGAIVDPHKWHNYPEILKFINGLFAGIQLYSDYKIHDADMAYQQALVHRIILTLNETLIQSECNQRTYIGERIRELAERIKLTNPKLIEIIQSNKKISKVLNTFQKNLKGFTCKK